MLRFCNDLSSIARAGPAAKLRANFAFHYLQAACVFIRGMGESGGNGEDRVQPGALTGLLVLSFLSALTALAPSLLPTQFSAALPPMAAQALALGLLAAAAGLFSWRQRGELPDGPQAAASLWIGLGLFTAPTILIHLASGWVSGFTRTALFTLVPVFAVVLDPYIGKQAAGLSRGSLPAALLAVLGAALVFPIAIPNSMEAIAAFGAVILAAIAVAAANGYAVAVMQPAKKQSLAPIAAIAATTGAFSLGILSASLERTAWQSTTVTPALFWTAALQLPSLWLLFWLMRRLSAVRLTLRFVLGPALAVPLGALLMQMPLTLRTWLGLLGMAAGAANLLLKPEAEPEAVSVLGPPNSR
jgi:drug/metabolite transporter (DMT)-like permease